MLHPAYPIRTERLVLRPFQPSDAPALHAYQSRADVCRYIPYEPRSLETVRERIDAATSTVDEPGSAMLLAAVRTEDDVLVGDVMLYWISREHANGEIGYVFDPRYQGHGYATEAANALLRLGFEELKLHRIVGRVDARNAPSIAVLQRIGMRQEAYLRENEWFKGEWTDEIDFAVLASEWRSWQ